MKNNLIPASLKISLSIVIVSALVSCGSENTNNVPPATDSIASLAPTSNHDGFYDIPSPVQQVQLLQKAGASYNKEILNPLDNVKKYTAANSQALNLGVYGADLSYAAVFNQPQDVVLYMSASHKLADALNIRSDFNAEMMQRLGKHGNNKDSLLQIVSDLYQRSNASLKENDQSHLSALVVVGSFIEAMYIATQVAKDVNNRDAIYNRIGEFKGSLNDLVALMATVADSDFANILTDLRTIKAIYEEKEGTKLSDEQVAKITKQIKATRIKITNM